MGTKQARQQNRATAETFTRLFSLRAHFFPGEAELGPPEPARSGFYSAARTPGDESTHS